SEGFRHRPVRQGMRPPLHASGASYSLQVPQGLTNSGYRVNAGDAAAQSARNAVSGSRRAARRAGIQHATSDAPANTAAPARYVTRSNGPTSNRSRPIPAPAPTAAIAPIAIPPPASRRPSRTTSRDTSPGRAPNATRTPSSGVRCATEYDSTPYSPTTASMSAVAANPVSSHTRNRRVATDRDTTSPSVVPPNTGNPPSTDQMVRCIAPNNAVGSDDVRTMNTANCVAPLWI